MKLAPVGYSHFWTIYDETMLKGSLKGTYEERIHMGGVITAASVEELAEKT